MEPLPRIRTLEILRLEQEDGGSFLLRDPEGYSTDELVLSEPALFVAAHADGKHTLDQVQESFRRRYGKPPDPAEIQDVLDRLEAAHMLETETFFAHRKKLQEAFLAAPVRMAKLKGTSYPETPEDAGREMAQFFETAAGMEEEGDRPRGRLTGLVAPHIDLRVGGPCTALAYNRLAEAPAVDTVVVLGTAHGCPHPAWIVSAKPFETPLGTVPVDEAACRRLAAAADRQPGEEYYHHKEHSIEFQALFLAWLRRQGRDLEMIPVLCGSLRGPGETDPGVEGETAPGAEGETGPGNPTPVFPPADDRFLQELGDLIRERGESILVVAAADLAHVGTRFGDRQPLDEKHLELLEKKDRQTLEPVSNGDAAGFFAAVMEANDPRRICGLSPIYGLLSVLPGSKGKLLRYEQATDPTGTVTYASLGLWS